MTSDFKAKAEIWYEGNLAPRQDNDFDFDSEHQKMQEKLASFKNECVISNGQTFLANIASARQLILTPAATWTQLAFEQLKIHLMQMNSPSEQVGNLVLQILRALKTQAAELPPVELAPARQKAKDVYDSVKTKDMDRLHSTVRSTILEALQNQPQLMDWGDKLIELTLCSAWSAFEVLASDLWEDMVNSSIDAAKNVCAFNDAEFDKESKKIDINQLFAFDLDLRSKMGTLLKDRFHFSNEGAFGELSRLAVRARIPSNQPRIFRCLRWNRHDI